MKSLWDLAYHQFVRCPHTVCDECGGRGAVRSSPGWTTCQACTGGVICPRTSRAAHKSA